MKNFNRTKKIILACSCTFFFAPTVCDLPKAEAIYESKSDTGTTIFDYIENRRRERRANALTDEQKKLLTDIAETKARLPKAIKEDDPVPAAFEGDDMVYNAVTGEFIATGKVDIIQIEGYRFQSDEATGNVITQDVEVEGKGHMLQLMKNAPRITLDGYNTHYNYGTKTGTMDSANGKAGEYYISGKRFEFYPDHIVVHDGRETKCGAKVPDYSVGAERMEIWPEQIIRMYNAKLYIKNKAVGTRKYMERKIDEAEENYFPRFGYDKDDGAYVEDSFELPLFTQVSGVLNAHVNSKHGVRSNAELHHYNRDFSAFVYYGFYRDANSNWIQRLPSLKFNYNKHLEKNPFSYNLGYEIGYWKNDSVTSRHQFFEVGLNRDPIVLPGKYYLFLHTSYTITKDKPKTEGVGKSQVNGMNYDATLAKEFDDNFAAFVAYHYNKSNSKNSLFAFDLDSYSSKFESGISYKFTNKDRAVVGINYNLNDKELADVDYYWFHDFHCSTAVIRWRAKRKKFEAHWEFTPW